MLAFIPYQPHSGNEILKSTLVFQMQKNENIPTWLTEASIGIIEHMNDDHADVIVATLYGQHGILDREAKMHKLETGGYYVVSNSRTYFLNFDDHCNSAEEYKQALIRHAREYKKQDLTKI